MTTIETKRFLEWQKLPTTNFHQKKIVFSRKNTYFSRKVLISATVHNIYQNSRYGSNVSTKLQKKKNNKYNVFLVFLWLLWRQDKKKIIFGFQIRHRIFLLRVMMAFCGSQDIYNKPSNEFE